MKKLFSIIMLLLVFSSNFFYFSFSENYWITDKTEPSESLDEVENLGENWENLGEDDLVQWLQEIQDFQIESWQTVQLSWWEVDTIQSMETQFELSNNELSLDSINIENSSEINLWQANVLLSTDQDFSVNQSESWEINQWNNPNLIISEVFFWSNNEWIEIYNEWSDFSGMITIVWASSTTKNFDVSIPNNWIIILKDKWVKSILDESLVVENDAWFNMLDSAAIDVNLMFSGNDIDSFYVSAEIVWDTSSKVSFQKFIDTKNITGTTVDFISNMSGWYFANPWMVYTQPTNSDPIVDSWTNNPDIENPIDTWNNLSWDIDTWINIIPNLKITEIYFDGNDNWFEISNIWWQDFSWELTLNWNLNFTISTEIPVWISKVFANNTDMFSWVNVEIIPDIIKFVNEEINRKLIWSWQILDTFFVHESRVNHLQWWWTSFEKVWWWDNWTTTYVWMNLDRIAYMNWWLSANPTIYFTQWENMKDVTINRNWDEIYTWSNYDLPIQCDDFWNDYSADISEIYFWNDVYPSYVELKITQDLMDYRQIFLSGSAISTPVYFRTRWIDFGSYVLLTSSPVWYDEWRNALQNADFQLNTSGWLMLYWIDSYWTDLLDVIYVSKSSAWNSVYMWTESLDCAGVFDYVDKFSPWLSIWQSNFIQITPEPIIKYITINNGSSCPNNEQTSFNISVNFSNEIQISAIKYYWWYQILKLKNKTNSDINLREYSIQTMDGKIQSIKWNTLLAKSTMSFVWNYGLPTNQDFCINLMKNWEVVDRYCRNSLTKANSTDEQNIKNQLSFWEDLNDEEWTNEEWIIDDEWNENLIENVLQTNIIKILNIDYDPAWADWDNETITLKLLTWSQINLSGYNLYYTKDWKTQKTKSQIQWILSFGNSQIFRWEFAFPNSTNDKKEVSVNLIDPTWKVVDTYIYNPNKITEIPSGNHEVLSVIDGDTIKISYANQEFSIRLAGIDAPESSSLRCGKFECFWLEAKQYLTSLIGWKTIYFEPASMDSFDRFVWYVFFDWENINEKIIKNWYAREYSYKNQTYKYQSLFQSAQDYARNHNLWLWWNQCNWQRLCPIEETQVKDNYIFNIENVIYDPDGSDDWKEEIWITMIEWFTVEFGTDFYLLVNDTKKSLKKYGSISPWETKKLIWTFGFPNNKMTTISFVYDGQILDSYTYDPELDKKLQEESTWQNNISSFGEIKITSILPNPFWTDWSNEEISILYVWEFPELNLSWFFLRIWTTKKKLSWTLQSNKETLLRWKFSFPNKWSCVEIGYGNQIFDKFCYTQPAEWQKFYISNGVLASLSTLDLSILKDSKLQNIGNKVCLVYAGQKFYCKNMPYSKLSTKRVRQNKMYKSFFDSFEDYMKDKRKIMYYDSEIKNYFELLDDVEDVILDGKSTLEIDWINYEISEFEAMYNAKYKKDPQNFILKYLDSLLPDWVSQKYHSLLQEYKDYLFQKNPPNI